MNDKPFIVGKWTVEPDLGRICDDKGEEVRLEPKAMEVLVFLANRAGEVVTRRELEESVWAGTVVSYEALSVTVNKLRKALHDTPRGSHYIETLSKRGYRLVAPVVRGAPAEDTLANGSSSRPSVRFVIPLLSLVAIVVIALLGYVAFHVNHDDRVGPAEHVGSADIAIAVLPFSNSTGNADQDYIANGLAEDVITDLSRLSRLLVISRTSVLGYTGTSMTPAMVGRELGVRYVLTGSVRKSSNLIRITTELTDVTTNAQIWAEHFDRKPAELMKVQDEITHKIAAALVIRLTDDEQVALSRSYTESIEAHDFYMRGRAMYGSITKEGNHLARKMFERAIELDPKFARAYSALALTYVDDYRRKWGEETPASADRAVEIARKAVAIDKTEALGHWVLGYVYLYAKKQPEAAIKSAEQALLLNPSFADAYALLASASSFLGRTDDAIRLTRYAMRLNPRSTVVYYSNLGRDYYFKEDYEESIKNLRAAIAGNFNYLNAHLYLAATLARTDDLDGAQWEIDDIRTLDPSFSLSYWAETQPYVSGEHLTRLVTDLRKAGVPE